MTVSADVLYLPILRPIQLPFRPPVQARHPVPVTGRSDGQHRIYRLPPREYQDGATYGPGGYVSSDPSSGHLIDLYA